VEITEEIYEGYDFLVMLIEAYRKSSVTVIGRMTKKDLEVLQFGIGIGWLEHARGEMHPMRPKFNWTEKAKKEIHELDNEQE